MFRSVYQDLKSFILSNQCFITFLSSNYPLYISREIKRNIVFCFIPDAHFGFIKSNNRNFKIWLSGKITFIFRKLNILTLFIFI